MKIIQLNGHFRSWTVYHTTKLSVIFQYVEGIAPLKILPPILPITTAPIDPIIPGLSKLDGIIQHWKTISNEKEEMHRNGASKAIFLWVFDDILSEIVPDSRGKLQRLLPLNTYLTLTLNQYFYLWWLTLLSTNTLFYLITFYFFKLII